MSTPSQADRIKLTPNLLPYPHHVAAPKIERLDLSAFNSLQANKVTKSLQKRTDEIADLIRKLQED